MLTQKVFGLSSVSDIMKGLLLQMVRNRTNLKQLCTLVSLERKENLYLSLCQVICFIICYCGIVSYMAFLSLFSLNRCPISAATLLAFLPLAVQPVQLGPELLECG